VEGPQAVREALRAGAVEAVFTTAAARERHPDLMGPLTHLVDDATLAGLTDAVTPQGLVAVAPCVDVTLAQALAGRPRRVAVLVDAADPGNVGTVIRVADAAGCDAVVLVAGVDPHNAKAVRASAGSLWHLPITRCSAGELTAALRAAGLTLLATTGGADADELHPGLPLPTNAAVLFGNEAHGLPPELLAEADQRLRVPLLGQAESLNLATAAAVTLYALAWSQASGLAH
jgi:TrmH family RNA methyltransferase